MYGELGRDGLGEATYLTKAERELAKRAGKSDEQGEERDEEREP